MNSAELQTLVDGISRPGYLGVPTGGILMIPPGVHTLTETLRIGGTTVNECRPFVTLLGHGAGALSPPQPGKPLGVPVGATVLQWAGPPGLPMIDACGVSELDLSRMLLCMDGPQGLAGVGIRLSANNAGSAITSNARLHHLAIAGSHERNGAVGVEITGETANDMVDRVYIGDSTLRYCGTAIRQDSAQACINRVVGCDLISWQCNVENVDGQLKLSSCNLGDLTPADESFRMVHLGANPRGRPHAGQQAFQTTLEDCHAEIRGGRGLVIDSHLDAPTSMVRCHISMQREAGGDMFVVDSVARAPIDLRGTCFSVSTASGLPQSAVLRHAGPLWGPWYPRRQLGMGGVREVQV